MKWNHHALAALLTIFPCAILGGEIYKCKAADGSVTFTNIKCPEAADSQHYGSYQRAPDRPQYVDEEYMEQTRGGGYADDALQQGGAVGSVPTANTRALDDIRRQDGRSTWGTAARNIRLHYAPSPNDSRAERAKKERGYAEAMRQLEQAALNGQRSPPNLLSDRANLRRIAEQMPAPEMPPKTVRAVPKAPVVQTCNQNAGGTITCFGTDGSVLNGHVNPSGRGTLFGSDGSVRQLNSTPDRDGACVLDQNGFCN